MKKFTFLEGIEKNEDEQVIKLAEIIIVDESGDAFGCEHCGYLKPFSLTVSTDITSYCIDCYEANNNRIPHKILKEAENESIKQEFKYIEKRYKHLKRLIIK